ncbi:aldo/keto reductase [Streptococcus anginosus]|uniref:aldo/keto reductase n=1 Tax=Streptococcus anginosus TaxID=1328 RepID=UPI001959B2B5
MIVELVSSGNLPKRLPLGSDAVRIIRDELKSRLAEVAVVMSGLIKEGKILHWGISEANEEYLRRAHEVCPVTCIQNRYSMMARWHENFFR